MNMKEDVEEVEKRIVFPRDLADPYRRVLGTFPGLKIVPIVGMAGIGKTALAEQIFQHSKNRASFECYAWVTVGQSSSEEQITRSILQQIIDPGSDEIVGHREEKERVSNILKVSRYLIVLDDVWDLRLWRKLSALFENQTDFSIRVPCRVVLTTRQQDVALGASRLGDVVRMPFLNDEESWDLLRRLVFDKMTCPRELEKAGKKIAEKCDGLPLTIVTVADILSRDDQVKTLEHWDKIAEKTRHPVFMEAYDEIYEVLYPSYARMSSIALKECFLYMGVFSLKQEIRTSKLIKLWSVEKLLKEGPSKTSAAQVAVEYLEDLHSRSLVLNLEESSNGGIKTSRLHSAFWYFCTRLGQEKEIFMILHSLHDCSVKVMERQHRLSFNNNVLFGIKDFRSLMDPVSPVRSLLCFAPYHRYEVPICSHLVSLRVIDALSIRFYDFPVEVVNLNELKYLALTCNANLPPTISKLKLLEFLIVSRHQSIKSSTCLLPTEVWDMKELKHLQVTGSDLPDPDSQDKLLPNLLTLLDVGAQSCTKSILKRVPNLEKLGVLIELPPDAPSSILLENHISRLKKLTSLKCVIVNPTLIAPPPLPNLPLGLKKLSLSGFGYPWEEMSKIASLPNLEVLKLRCFAFRGPKWESCGAYGPGGPADREFKKLKYLLVEDTDLVEWVALRGSFDHIRRIIFKNCYRFEDVPLQFWGGVRVDLVDCNPSAAKFSSQQYMPVRYRNVHAMNSWEKQG